RRFSQRSGARAGSRSCSSSRTSASPWRLLTGTPSSRWGRSWRPGAPLTPGRGPRSSGTWSSRTEAFRHRKGETVRKRGWVITSGLVVLGLAMLPAAVRSADQKPIVIAIPVGLSGVNSVVAPAVVQSAELAADELNAKGGIMGRKVEVVPLDDESGPAGAV